MPRFPDRIRRFYAAEIRPDERVSAVLVGYATRTATLIGAGSLLGGVVGWLYAIYMDAAYLPAIVLGGFIGITGGFFYADNLARHPSGPGAATFAVVVTTERLMMFRSANPVRPKLLRSIDLDSITAIATRRYPIASYHQIRVTTDDGTNTAFITDRLPETGLRNATRPTRNGGVNRTPTSG